MQASSFTMLLLQKRKTLGRQRTFFLLNTPGCSAVGQARAAHGFAVRTLTQKHSAGAGCPETPPGHLCPCYSSQLRDAPWGLGTAVSPQRAPPLTRHLAGSPRTAAVAQSPASPALTTEAGGAV